MSSKCRCLIWRRCTQTGVTVIVSFMFAYALFQCVLLVMQSVFIKSNPDSDHGAQSLLWSNHEPNQIGPPQSNHVMLGYSYSVKDFVPESFVSQVKQTKNRRSGDIPKSAVDADAAEADGDDKDTSIDKKQKPPSPAKVQPKQPQQQPQQKQQQQQHKKQLIDQTTAKSVNHCQRQSPYYDPSIKRSAAETLHVTLERALTLLNTVSGSKGLGHALTPTRIASHLCQVNQTELLVVIQSELRNSSQRNRIRQSWATLDYFNFDATTGTGGPATAPSKVDYLFLVDFVYDVNVSMQDLDVFMLEIQREQDILPIQLTPVEKRQSQGYLLASEFVLARCDNRLRYVTFFADDLMPNTPLLGSFAAAQHSTVVGPDSKPDPMFCFVVENEHPVRPKKKKNAKEKQQQTDKVIVTQSEWPKPVFPTYCDMRIGGFLLSLRSLKLWSACAQVHRPFEKIPPVYLTGILTEAAGIPMQRYWTTYGDPVPLLPSLGSGAGAGQHLFFTQTQFQPLWVWKSVFQAILAEALR